MTEGAGLHDDTVRERARSIGQDVAAALDLARELAPVATDLPAGAPRYLSTLASLGAGDLVVARVVEPHLDALAILDQAGLSPADAGAPPDATWGVYAAHSPRHHLEASRTEAGWTLTGTKPWCSLADQVSHAVVTAHVPGEGTAAFAVPLRHEGVRGLDEPWVARGLSVVRSTGLVLKDCPAVPVGGPGWYLERPGFAWGGIGVAAVWVGAARALADALVAAAGRREPDQLAHVHLGLADRHLFAAELALLHAGSQIAEGAGTGPAGALLAARVRSSAAHAAEEVIALVGRALGPAPLTGDEEHARRVADLMVYVRQHHAERDLARTGEMLLTGRPR